VPVLLDPSLLDGPPDAPTLKRLRSRQGSAWLFVGRLAPNKAQHDVVKAFALYRRSHDPAAVLWLIGAPAPERYAAALRGYIDALGLSDAVELRGDATTAELGAYYRAADVFVCLSDHEGFCVPLLEAWAHELPIVAYASSAVPETVGDAGVLLADKPAGTVAAAVDRVVRDAALRGALVGRGARRLASTFAPERVRGEFVQALERVA
jgi:glycosyltransferase involved in cell wall biosynthesis